MFFLKRSLVLWEKHRSPQNNEKEPAMKEKTKSRRTATSVRNSENPSKDLLCHPKGLWVGYEEEDESRVKGIFGLQGKINGRGLGFVGHS